MSDNKASNLLAMAAVLGLGAQMAAPLVPGPEWHMPKLPPTNKGRSNNKWGARAKDRAREKAAHKSRMAQKRRK